MTSVDPCRQRHENETCMSNLARIQATPVTESTTCGSPKKPYSSEAILIHKITFPSIIHSLSSHSDQTKCATDNVYLLWKIQGLIATWRSIFAMVHLLQASTVLQTGSLQIPETPYYPGSVDLEPHENRASQPLGGQIQNQVSVSSRCLWWTASHWRQSRICLGGNCSIKPRKFEIAHGISRGCFLSSRKNRW